MKEMYKYRKNIELAIIEGLCKSQIAKKIKRSPATVSNEINRHRKIKPRNTFNMDSICIHLKECHRYINKCERYQEPICKRRDRNIGACNSCPNIKSCKLDKYFYYANKANESYLYTLVDSRAGVNLDYPELKQIATIIKALLDKGQSLYQILENHKEITQCSKTLYTYIEMGLFKDFGIDCFSLRKEVSRRIKSKKLKKDVNQLIIKVVSIRITLNILRLIHLNILRMTTRLKERIVNDTNRIIDISQFLDITEKTVIEYNKISFEDKEPLNKLKSRTNREHKWQLIQEVQNEYKKYSIAGKKFNIDRRTVKKYVALTEAPINGNKNREYKRKRYKTNSRTNNTCIVAI